MKILLICLVITAPVVAGGGAYFPVRTLAAMCEEEALAAEIDGDTKRSNYYQSFIAKKPVKTLADVIADLKKSVPDTLEKHYRTEVLADIDRAPLAFVLSSETHGYRKFIRPLLKANVDVNQTDRIGNSSLLYAAFQSNPCLVTELLKRGANKTVNLKNNVGLAPLTLFYLVIKLQDNHRTVIKALLNAGATVEDPETFIGKDEAQRPAIEDIQKFAAEIAAAKK